MGYDNRTDDAEESEEKEEPDGIIVEEGARGDNDLTVFDNEKDECSQVRQSGDIRQEHLTNENISEVEVGINKKKQRKKQKPRTQDDDVEDDTSSKIRRRKKKRRLKHEHPDDSDGKHTRHLEPGRRTPGVDFESVENDRRAYDELGEDTSQTHDGHADDSSNNIIRKHELTSEAGDIRTSSIVAETSRHAHDGHQYGRVYKSKSKSRNRNTTKCDQELQRDARGSRAVNMPEYSATTTESSKPIDDLFLSYSSVRDNNPCSSKSRDNTNTVRETEKKRKKTKRLKNLKKASSKVGILNTTVADETHESSASDRKDVVVRTRDTHDDESLLLSPKSLDSGAVSGSSPSPETQGTEPAHPKPLLICRIIAGYPLTSFFSITLIHLATFSISAGLALSGYNVFPLVFDTLPLYTYNDARLNELAWKSRNNYDDWVYRPMYGASFYTGYRSRLKDTVEVIYESNVNILTKPFFESIKNAEERLFNMHDFKRYFCLLESYYTCHKPQSLLRLFDGTYSHLDAIFSDQEFSNVTNVIYMATQYNETKEFVELFLGKDSVVTPDYVSSSITRSFFLMGWPLYRMANSEYGSFRDLESFLIDKFKPEIENIRDFYLVGLLDVYYLSKIMYEYDLTHQALKDLMLAIGSVSFIFVFMSIQTGSVVVTFLGIMSILSSFFMTNLIYRYVFQFIYFGFFHIISIFLILGIGADDLFVFYDTWRLTGDNTYPSDAHRLSDCYRRAAKTTFVTSCTTMMAFFVSGLSPLLPVKTFGIFSGLLVLLNYIWVIVYFPTIIMLHHLKTKYIWYYIRDFICPCFASSNDSCRKRRNSQESTGTISESLSDSGCSKNDVSNAENGKSEKSAYKTEQSVDTRSKDSSSNQALDKLTSIHFKFSKRSSNVDDDGTNRPSINLKELEDQRHIQEWKQLHLNQPKRAFDQRNRIIKFLKNAFFDFMTLRIVKFLIPIILLMASIFFIMSAATLEPDTHQLRLWRSSHNYAKASNRHYFSFIRNQDDEYQRLYLVWGLEKADVSVCNMKSADFCFGDNQRDEQFDMNTADAQLAFKALCERLDNIDEETAEKLRIRRNTITGKLHVSCFARDFDEYFQAEVNTTSGGSRNYPEGMSLTMPINSSNVRRLMTANPYIYISPLPTDFKNYFEILVGYWLTNGYTTRASDDYFSYNNLLTEEADQSSKSAYYRSSGLYYGTRLRYLAVEINTTMNVYSLGYKEGLPVYRAWEEFMDSINNDMPHPVNKGFQVTENLWHWIHVQEILANSAIMGIVIGICSAWPILVLTTFNYIIGTLATITIGLVTACVVGMVPLVGWKLGVLESINLCMVVGLSVDYIVHLAEAYRMSESERRLDKVRDMLESMGLSVVSGAFTTIGAAVFMLFAQIQFFFQFGIFIISTVGIALLFSLFGFTTLMAICGPQGQTGSLMPVCTALCARLERGGGEADEEEKLECVGPTVITDRLYNWLSYRKGEKK